MSRADALRATVSRCRDRASHAEQAFNRFCNSGADLNQQEARYRHRALKTDWEQAQRDCEWAKEQLERALDLERVFNGMALRS